MWFCVHLVGCGFYVNAQAISSAVILWFPIWTIIRLTPPLERTYHELLAYWRPSWRKGQSKRRGHEDILDCAIRFERAARALGRAFLLANGATEAELPYLEVEDGMKPWSCRPTGAARVADKSAEPGS